MAEAKLNFKDKREETVTYTASDSLKKFKVLDVSIKPTENTDSSQLSPACLTLLIIGYNKQSDIPLLEFEEPAEPLPYKVWVLNMLNVLKKEKHIPVDIPFDNVIFRLVETSSKYVPGIPKEIIEKCRAADKSNFDVLIEYSH